MNNELKKRLIAALESSIANSGDLLDYWIMNMGEQSAKNKTVADAYRSEITECQELINELQDVVTEKLAREQAKDN